MQNSKKKSGKIERKPYCEKCTKNPGKIPENNWGKIREILDEAKFGKKSGKIEPKLFFEKCAKIPGKEINTENSRKSTKFGKTKIVPVFCNVPDTTFLVS